VDYQFSLNEEDINSLHGFLHNQPFDVVAIEENDSSAELILGYHYNGIAKGYPFAYDMRIIYRYDERGFEVITEITNTCGSVMPIGDGWHPYYRFEDIDQIKLKFGRATRIASNFGNGLNAKHGFEELSTIGDLVMDDCFKIEDAGSEYEIQIEDQKRGITLSLWQECDKNRYQYFHIYTPPERKTMAFEPVTSPINSFSTGVSLIELRPLESFTAKFGVGINRRRGHE
jgi:aldose 1-epimerase